MDTNNDPASFPEPLSKPTTEYMVVDGMEVILLKKGYESEDNGELQRSMVDVLTINTIGRHCSVSTCQQVLDKCLDLVAPRMVEFIVACTNKFMNVIQDLFANPESKLHRDLPAIRISMTSDTYYRSNNSPVLSITIQSPAIYGYINYDHVGVLDVYNGLESDDLRNEFKSGCRELVLFTTDGSYAGLDDTVADILGSFENLNSVCVYNLVFPFPKMMKSAVSRVNIIYDDPQPYESSSTYDAQNTIKNMVTQQISSLRNLIPSDGEPFLDTVEFQTSKMRYPFTNRAGGCPLYDLLGNIKIGTLRAPMRIASTIPPVLNVSDMLVICIYYYHSVKNVIDMIDFLSLNIDCHLKLVLEDCGNDVIRAIEDKIELVAKSANTKAKSITIMSSDVTEKTGSALNSNVGRFTKYALDHSLVGRHSPEIDIYHPYELYHTHDGPKMLAKIL